MIALILPFPVSQIRRAADFITTKGLSLKRILEEGGNLDDIKAFILERIPY